MRSRRASDPGISTVLSFMPPKRAPTTPAHLLRVHLAAVNALYISDDNERLYSGDTTGVVIVTSTRSFRPIAQWPAHKDGILTVVEWENQVITCVTL